MAEILPTLESIATAARQTAAMPGQVAAEDRAFNAWSGKYADKALSEDELTAMQHAAIIKENQGAPMLEGYGERPRLFSRTAVDVGG